MISSMMPLQDGKLVVYPRILVQTNTDGSVLVVLR